MIKNNNIGIITGAGKGIGLETCRLMLSKNYKIIAITRSKSTQLEFLKKKYKSNLLTYYIDITNKNSVKENLNFVFKKYQNINFLVNNAGVRFRKSIKNSNLSEIEDIFDNNIISQINFTKNYLSKIKKSKKNSIVFLSSIVGPRGFEDLSIYSSTKGAIESFMKSLAIEYASENVRVNSVSPGFVETSYAKDFKNNRKQLYKWTIERTPMKRWGKAIEVANVIEFLISDKSSYITGTNIFVDGGWTAGL